MYQVSPWVDVTSRCRPDGSKNILYMVISFGFLGIWMIESCSGRANSRRTSRLSTSPITSVLEDTTSDASAAGSVYSTRSRSNRGLLELASTAGLHVGESQSSS